MERTFFEQLEAADNEAEVRERLAAGLYNVRHAAIAKEFLRRREEKREAEASARAEAREEENLKIARESVAISRKALHNSRFATRIAVIAAVLSVVLAIQKLVEWYAG